MGGGQKEIGIFLDVFGYVDDTGGADEFSWWDAVDGRVREVLAGNPVDGSVEMGAGVLAGLEGVPIPEGAAGIVAGEFAEGEGRSVVPLGGEREEGRGGTQWEGEIDDAQAAGVESFDELEKDFRHS